MGGWNQVGCWELGLFLKRLQLLFLETILTLLLLKIDGFPFFTFSERVSVAVNATHLIKYILEKAWNGQKTATKTSKATSFIQAYYEGLQSIRVQTLAFFFQYQKAPFHQFIEFTLIKAFYFIIYRFFNTCNVLNHEVITGKHPCFLCCKSCWDFLTSYTCAIRH